MNLLVIDEKYKETYLKSANDKGKTSGRSSRTSLTP
jgi:hypothetical protein